MLPTATEVPFHGDTLLTVEQDGQHFVAIKPICERIGLSWQPQHRKLTDPENDWGCHHMVIPTRGGLQEMTCLALIDFPLWLASISASKIREEGRETFKLYQREAKQVLFDHFIKRQQQSETALATSHAHLLAQFPRWMKIVTLIRSGVSEYLVYKRSNMTHEHFDAELKEIERCGLLDPASMQITQTETLLEERDRLLVERVLLNARVEQLEDTNHG